MLVEFLDVKEMGESPPMDRFKINPFFLFSGCRDSQLLLFQMPNTAISTLFEFDQIVDARKFFERGYCFVLKMGDKKNELHGTCNYVNISTLPWKIACINIIPQLFE